MQKRSTPKTALYVVLLVLGGVGAVSGVMTASFVLVESPSSATIFVGLLTAALQFVGAVAIGVAAYYYYYRTGESQHVGLWLFLGFACFTLAAQDLAFPILVAEVGFRVFLGSIGIGINLELPPLGGQVTACEFKRRSGASSRS